MDLSGLIFVALAVVWAVVLIPMALRQHDEAAKTRAVDHFSDDLRVVARREAVTTSQSRLVVPPRSRGPRDLPTMPDSTPHPTPVEEPAGAETAPPAAPVARPQQRDRAAVRAAARAAAKRRRIVLGLLLLVTAGVGVASFLGVLLPWASAVPGGLVLAFLALARLLVRREHRAWEAARRAPATATHRSSAHTGGHEVTVGGSASHDEPAPSTPVPADESRDVRVAAPQTSFVSGLDDTCAVPVGLTADGSRMEGLWDPLPMTLPTYVTKPRAQRTVRTIDMLDPGVHSSGRSAADSALVAEAATALPTSEETGRRAVGH